MDKDRLGFARLLDPFLRTLNLKLTDGQLSQLYSHYSLLLRWRDRVNLTAVREPAQIVERHFAESLFLASRLDNPVSVVDVGSGAGFPGIPLAVRSPRLPVTLIESSMKKVTFLKEASRELPNLNIVWGRLEKLSAQFEWATVRGVPLNRLARVLRPRVGKVAILTSAHTSREIRRLSEFLWEPAEKLPWDGRRVLLFGSAKDVSRGT
jgi:16S rRNA (guanine527-N7)-methyltransferase